MAAHHCMGRVRTGQQAEGRRLKDVDEMTYYLPTPTHDHLHLGYEQGYLTSIITREMLELTYSYLYPRWPEILARVGYL